MNIVAALAAFAAFAAASPAEELAKSTALDVMLDMVGNSEIKATFTNNGKRDLKVLKVGSILDPAPVEKAKVSRIGVRVPFHGVRMAVLTDSLEEEDFQRIAAGESINTTFDAAEVHNLSPGGTFSFLVDGVFSTADENSTELTGSVPYTSPVVEREINGTKADAVRLEFHHRRAKVENDCSGDQLSKVQAAIGRCSALARQAEQAVRSGPAAKMEEYWKSSTPEVRQTVAGVFSKVANECSFNNSGRTTFHCTDTFRSCRGRSSGYTMQQQSAIVFCPTFFNELTAVDTRCHSYDQGTIALHEATHLYETKGTSDFGGYGYQYVRSLSGAQNLNHADTYTLFVNALSARC